MMWVKLCYFGRISFKTAWLVRMIIAVTTGMKYFLLIFCISVLGFANSFLLLNRMGNDTFLEVQENEIGTLGDDNVVRTSGETGIWAALRYSYRTALGDFNTDALPEAGIDNVLVFSIWLISSFLNVIVILNAVIAIVSDIFDNVYENMNKNLLKELVVLMAESELLISRKNLFKKKKYVLLIQKEQGNLHDGNNESKIAVIKDYMNFQSKRQHEVLEKIQNNLGMFIDNKLSVKREELEAFTEKRLDSVNQQIEILDLHHKQYQDLFQKIEEK